MIYLNKQYLYCIIYLIHLLHLLSQRCNVCIPLFNGLMGKSVIVIFSLFCISIIVLCNRTFAVLFSSHLLLELFSSIFFSSLSNPFLRVLVYYYCNSILSLLLFSFTFLHLHNSTQFFSYYDLIFSNIPISFSSYHVSSLYYLLL